MHKLQGIAIALGGKLATGAGIDKWISGWGKSTICLW
jgi:hypothetical protein